MNKGCTATDSPLLPELVNSESTLIVLEDSDCYEIEESHWSHIIISYSRCNELSELMFSDYPNLVTLVLGSSFDSVESVILEST